MNHKKELLRSLWVYTVSPKKLETGLRTKSAGIPYTLLLRIEAIGLGWRVSISGMVIMLWEISPITVPRTLCPLTQTEINRDLGFRVQDSGVQGFGV